MGREEGKEAEGILEKHESLRRCSKNKRSHFETEEEMICEEEWVMV